MSQPVFNGKVKLITTSNQDGLGVVWDVSLLFSDGEGAFTGNNALVGDVVLFDTSDSDLATITQYKIINIFYKNSSTINCRIQLDDDNVIAPDLFAALGIDGAISRPTPNKKLTIVPSPGAQGLPDKFAIYPLNANASQRIDTIQTQGVSQTLLAHRDHFTVTQNIIENGVELSADEVSDIVPNSVFAFIDRLGLFENFDFQLSNGSSGKVVFNFLPEIINTPQNESGIISGEEFLIIHYLTKVQ